MEERKDVPKRESFWSKVLVPAGLILATSAGAVGLTHLLSLSNPTKEGFVPKDRVKVFEIDRCQDDRWETYMSVDGRNYQILWNRDSEGTLRPTLQLYGGADVRCPERKPLYSTL